MEKSETISELAKALAAFQGAMESVLKTKVNPFYHSKYADLDAIWEACRGRLSANGLALVQTTTWNDQIILETMLLHTSGEWIKGSLAINAAKLDPQAVGSAITYARRYGMSAMLGISSEDDDDAESNMPRATKTGTGVGPGPQDSPEQSSGTVPEDFEARLNKLYTWAQEKHGLKPDKALKAAGLKLEDVIEGLDLKAVARRINAKMKEAASAAA